MSDTPDLAEALLQCSTDCIKILDENAKVQFFNRNGLLAMEIDDFSAVANLYWPALWPEDVRPLLEARLAEARVSGVSHLKAACPTAKGTPKWWEITIAALPGSDSRRFVVISKDVTRQEELEANDRRSLDRMSVAFRNSADVMWDIDLTRNEVWWSEGIQSLFGYGADQVGSSTQWCHEHMHPDDRERVVESMTAAVANGDVRWESEFRYRKADGGYLEVHDQGAIVRDAAGKALRFVGTMKDVTARNAASAQERQMAAELAHRMNNTLAVITGIFHRSVKSSASIDELAQVFGSRLVAMATANSDRPVHTVMRGNHRYRAVTNK